MMRVLVTGANGFIGRYLCPFLVKNDFEIDTVSFRNVEDVNHYDLADYDAIIHLAALAHQMQGAPDEAYMSSNYELTKALADKAKSSKVGRFIFISSVKVYGETSADQVLNEDSACLPQDAYGQSKLLAEQYLQSMADDQFKIAILRLPLVYGPEVKGNFLSLLNLHANKKLIPFKNIIAQRSMVFVGNVCALIMTLLSYQGNQQIFIAADDVEPIQINVLSELMLQGLGRQRQVLFCRFPALMQWLIKQFKPEIHRRLFEDFKFTAARTFNELAYQPAFTIKEGIEKTCNWYLGK
ncbi:NAD-dependent epimerase/dehydratase family protein [Legionella jordanis]|nr:NAD-dependent epimerase/dehydratase family protein [Legionella jordanis]RMX19162.1 NAD-dependent epimerase/dehydratase family protein [Legionella jordanis]